MSKCLSFLQLRKDSEPLKKDHEDEQTAILWI